LVITPQLTGGLLLLLLLLHLVALRSGGVIDTCCSELNHGVLAVGYGTDEATGHPYYLIKNSEWLLLPKRSLRFAAPPMHSCVLSLT
jgi:hypothetical protein